MADNRHCLYYNIYGFLSMASLKPLGSCVVVYTKYIFVRLIIDIYYKNAIV